MTPPNNVEIERIMEARGVRPTSNRILVMKEFLKASHPLTLADLEEKLDFTMDKASIFRVLELFAGKDMLHVMEDGSRSLKYELCHSEGSHTISDQHVHFYCERCKEVFCFEDLPIPPVSVPEGFHPHSINYMIKGLCRKCSSRTANQD